MTAQQPTPNLSDLERRFWEKKLAIAKQNHATELLRGGKPGGISLKRLAIYVADIERAERKLSSERKPR